MSEDTCFSQFFPQYSQLFKAVPPCEIQNTSFILPKVMNRLALCCFAVIRHVVPLGIKIPISAFPGAH